MASYVIGPWQVDPNLIGGGSAGTVVITDRKQLGSVLWPAIAAGAWSQPFIVAFSSERGAAGPNGPTALRNAVLRFATADTAAATAQAMSSTAMNMPVTTNTDSPIPVEPIRSVPIPGHPDINGALLTRREGDKNVHELTVISAQGPYVLTQVAQSALGPDAAAAFAGRALDLQVPLIDRFQPTDPARFADISLDPTGLLARTLPLKTEGSSMSNATYDPPGALHLEDNPIQAERAFTDAGVDVASIGQTSVYQARDPDSAQQLSDALGDDTAHGATSQPAPAVPGLSQSRCLRIDQEGGLIPRYWCIATVGRFAVKAVARQLDNAHQQIAAQYRILAG